MFVTVSTSPAAIGLTAFPTSPPYMTTRSPIGKVDGRELVFCGDVGLQLMRTARQIEWRRPVLDSIGLRERYRGNRAEGPVNSSGNGILRRAIHGSVNVHSPHPQSRQTRSISVFESKRKHELRNPSEP